MKFFFKEISKLSRISKLMHLDLKVHSSCLCETIQCLDLTHSKVYYSLTFEGERSYFEFPERSYKVLFSITKTTWAARYCGIIL